MDKKQSLVPETFSDQILTKSDQLLIIYAKNQTLDDIRSAAVDYNDNINKYLSYWWIKF